ncbi:hypothetical protein HELRODRAFT_193825 [Helobdella robusta]|uniref:DDHD domain-containing protein n=1 Tax=Helobdella robusta TaxID=6412 RepID=T1FVE3_HELRO|nr:hypothetical protein HELRODRAFT_193825 [Helobdella robusta]ESN94061.1 hypothetical protein HELRODRAFT_193825 [Helobdella robusta]
MAQRKTEFGPSAQPSALLMVSPEEMNFSLLSNMNTNLGNNNIPTLIPVRSPPSPTNSDLLLADEGDVDSFVGQISVSSSQLPLQNSQQQGPTSFTSQVTNYITRSIGAVNQINNKFDVGFNNQQTEFISSTSLGYNSNFSSAPPTNYNAQFGNAHLPLPPSSSSSSSSSSSQYRHTGKFQYVVPPECLPSTAQQQPPPSIYNNLPQNRPTPTNQTFYAPPQQQLPSAYPAPNQVALGGFNQIDQGVSINPGVSYVPPEYHWFFSKKIEDKIIWMPFSFADSKRLEEAFESGLSDNQMVPVKGGRYDVDMSMKMMLPVFWTEEEMGKVMRCLWFYRSASENEFVPYDEMFSAGIEESYRQTILTCDFHKRLAYPNGETIIIHTPTTIVHYPSSSQPDAWGNVVNDVRPRVVRRGISEFDNIPKDERANVDHLVFIVQGFKPMFGVNNRKVTEYADDFRQIADQMLTGHFEKPINEGVVGRVEFIPITWSHDQYRNDVTNVDNKLRSITLPRINKLRTFTNETLLDILFFTSPSHAQKTATELTDKLNLTFDLFKSRHPQFKGGVSIIGHGIGSLIVYDLLSNQGEGNIDSAVNNQPIVSHLVSTNQHNANPVVNNIDGKVKPPSFMTLEEVMGKLNLKDYEDVFMREKIDVSSLLLLTDSDIKEIGLPLGPRKKIQEFIKEQKDKEFLEKSEVKENRRQQQQMQQLDLFTQSTTTTTATSTQFQFTTDKLNDQNYKGIDIQQLNYPLLNFKLSNFFAFGSPVALLLALRGVHSLGDEYKLPTCPGYYNIFHPYDPLAYRMEPLVLPQVPSKAVLIPHHKGRKRLHLELKESLARIGFDIKQRIVESFRSTWRTINNLAATYRGGAGVSTPAISSPAELKINDEDVDSEVRNVLTEIQQQADDAGSVVTSSVADEMDLPIGALNQGRRIDFVLQEKPIEIFNDYLFALASSSCYWQSEDTALLMLKEIYLEMGLVPHKPGMPILPSQPGFAVVPPPKTGFVQPAFIPRYPAPPTNAPLAPSTIIQPYNMPSSYASPTGQMPPSNHEQDSYFNQQANYALTNPIGEPLRPPAYPSALIGGFGLQGSPMPVRPANQITGPPPRSGFVKL